ncbi:MAG: dihydroorotase [Pontiellaceae bacterium]|jgi:dihydroorotase|nr:dihydroorotase [Pontiellaceae bacterium]
MSTLPTILIKNADVVNEGSIRPSDVLIRNGRIDRIDGIIDAQTDLVINAAGKALLPGMIDCHVHFREPGLTYKGDMQSESRAAAAGGVTSVMEMPNTLPPATTNERLNEKFSLAAQKMAVNYSFYLGASLNNLDEIKAVDRNRVCGVKLYLGSSTGDMLTDDTPVLEKIFRECPVNLAAHCENARIIQDHEQIFREHYGDQIPFAAHPHIRSEEACFLNSKLAVDLAQKYDARLHILHVSTAHELELFTDGLLRVSTPRENEFFIERNEAVRKITSEVCVHYLHFDSTAYGTHGARIKCNPAIKRASDREALLRGLLTDRIDTIGTDHAPHTIEEKKGTYWTAPSGMPVIQSALPAILEHFYNGIIPLEVIAAKTAHTPARIFNLIDRGFIREGYWADLVLIDLNKAQTVTRENILYKCGWSPFEGVTFHSSVDTTLVSGQIAWQNGKSAPCCGHRLDFDR